MKRFSVTSSVDDYLLNSIFQLASGVMDALEILARGAVTANTVAKFIIDTLNVLMNVGLF